MISRKIVLLALLLCISNQQITLISSIKDKKDTATAQTILDPQVNVTILESYVPCGDKDSCGQAKTFGSDKEFADFVNKYVQPEPIYYKQGGYSTVTMQTSASKGTPTVEAKNDFSGTNNQVNGVDQADLLKTDGTYIYTFSNKILSIILAYPANKAGVISNTTFDALYPQSLFIQGNYLAVFGTKWGSAQGGSYPGPQLKTVKSFMPYYYSSPTTWIKIYDVSNKAKPFLTKQYKVEGSYFNGRKLGNGFVYLIINHSFQRRLIPNPWYDFGEGQKNILFNNIFYYPISYVNPQSVNIISFSLKNPHRNQHKVISLVCEYTNIMYMSDRHIYLTNSVWQNGKDYTTIRKVFVYGTYIRPCADGKVRGSVNNQFSLDEYGSILRIATTNNADSPTTNNVFCLDYWLNLYGSLTGIASGERIFSARYVGFRLYMVTFRQVDPFFVISLRNHRKPKILGELKVPGFSRYLHPYDETTIIGFGRDADSSGRQLGLKIGLFDVTDATNPLQSYTWSIQQKYAYSTAEWQHKAFLFSAEKNLLVVPGNMNYNGTQFNGAFAFYINKTYVELKNVIDHVLNPSDQFYDRNVERSLYIEQLLYTKSKCLLRINKINNRFDGVKTINIPCQVPIVKPIKQLTVTPIVTSLQTTDVIDSRTQNSSKKIPNPQVPPKPNRPIPRPLPQDPAPIFPSQSIPDGSALPSAVNRSSSTNKSSIAIQVPIILDNVKEPIATFSRSVTVGTSVQTVADPNAAVSGAKPKPKVPVKPLRPFIQRPIPNQDIPQTPADYVTSAVQRWPLPANTTSPATGPKL